MKLKLVLAQFPTSDVFAGLRDELLECDTVMKFVGVAVIATKCHLVEAAGLGEECALLLISSVGSTGHGFLLLQISGWTKDKALARRCVWH